MLLCQSNEFTAEQFDDSAFVDYSACAEVFTDTKVSQLLPSSVLRPVCDGTFSAPPLTDRCKFPDPFNWAYCKRAINTMGVKSTRFALSRWLVAYIVVRLRELHGLADDIPLDLTFATETDASLTHEQYCEIHGIHRFLKVVDAIPFERQSMAQFFICAARGLCLAHPRVDCAVQCDVESQGASADISDTFTDDAEQRHQGMRPTERDSTEASNTTDHTPPRSNSEPVTSVHDVRLFNLARRDHYTDVARVGRYGRRAHIPWGW